MYFYVDESGDFAVPEHSGVHRTAVAMSVAISDLVHDRLRADFQSIVATLDSSEFRDGEPKGSLMSPVHLNNFCDMLARYDGISITPVTLDLSSIANVGAEYVHQGMHERLRDQVHLMIYPGGKEMINLLASQWRKLDPSQTLRIYSWAYCIHEALHHAIIFLSNRGHESCWETIRVEIDRVQVSPNSREERVFSFMVMGWLAGWSRSRPFPLVEEIHTASHPFVRLYDTEDGINITKLMFGNIHWVNSAESWGVQLADIAAYIVSRATYALDDRDGSISLYGSLMRSSRYGARRGPGIFTPIQDAPSSTSGKYVLLSEAMRKNRKLRS